MAIGRTQESISKPPHVGLFTVLLYKKEAAFPNVSDQSKRGREKAQETATIFYNIILEMAIHHFCSILFIRSKTVSPAHTEVEGII